MSRKKEIVQGVIKKHGTSSFGKDPSDPWSTKSEIPENVEEGITSKRKSLLDKFLKSKGYNSTFITKDQKDSHSKGGEFIKWKRDHGIYEDIEELEELSKDTLGSYVKKANKQVRSKTKESELFYGLGHRAKYQKNKMSHTGTAVRADNMANKRIKGINKAVDKLTKEDSFADPQAATQQVNGGPEDAEPKMSKQSKSCFVVKSLHKKRVNEDMYDWEKSDKAEKGPKKSEQKQIDGDTSKSKAAMVLKGGSTMTGQGRDTIEIDPELNRRNNIPDQRGIIKSKDPK